MEETTLLQSSTPVSQGQLTMCQPRFATVLFLCYPMFYSIDIVIEIKRAALLARQHSHTQLVEVFQLQIVQVSEKENPKCPSDSAEEWGDAQTIIQGRYVRMWKVNTIPLSPWQPSLARTQRV